MTELQLVSFPPDVLARIAPEVALSRHLAIGIRPNLRNFHEFKAVSVSNGDITRNGNVVGSSVVRSGSTMIMCSITAGVIEDAKSDALLSEQKRQEFSTVYPVVEISRGRSGAPTDEEMILSQRLYETILHSKLIPSSSLNIEHGISVVDDQKMNIYYPDSHSEEFDILRSGKASKKYSFVLSSHIKVFSRTGPLFDLCYLALTHALSSTILPRIYISDFNPLRIPINKRGRFSQGKAKQTTFNIDQNEKLKYALTINRDELGISSNFGVSGMHNTDQDGMEVDDDPILLADIDGECEENSIHSKIDLIANEKYLKNVSLVGGGETITLKSLKDAIKIAKLRAKDFEKFNEIS
ncbi:uncharacterized protein PRCAT00000665001 [Priceomyces carsonii]|uniref:uncharacterized protein n=1 Tax=Priceomyces carsonii TaxID=28549 RepID=UPI002EDB5180|nr:unnamed protein product [Priceomyces carsonii]